MPVDMSRYPDEWKTIIVPRVAKRACGVGVKVMKDENIYAQAPLLLVRDGSRMVEGEMNCKTALLVVLDAVDYTRGACGVTEMVGAVLPKSIIELARQAIADEVESVPPSLCKHAHIILGASGGYICSDCKSFIPRSMVDWRTLKIKD